MEGAWTFVAIKLDREALPYDASIEMQVQCTLQVEHIILAIRVYHTKMK